MKQTIIFIALTLLFSSCGVYRKYRRPEDVTTASAYRDTDTMQRDTSMLASLAWQDLFTDSHLQRLIEEGLQQNLDFRIAALRVAEAEAILRSSRLAYLPSVNLTPQGNLNSFDGVTPSKTYSLAASASWELDIFGKQTNTKLGDKAAFESSKAYRQAVKTQLIATIANSYYTLLRLDRQQEINRKTLEVWDANISVLRLLKEAGQTNDAAILSAASNRMALESSILSVQKSIYDTENSLSALLGREPKPVNRGTLAGQSFPDTLSAGVPLQLLSNRPDVRQAEYDLAQAFYSTNVARSAFYPSVTLSGTAGWTNNSGGGIVNPGAFLWNAVGSLVQPIFNRGVNRANLEIAKVRQEEMKLRFHQSILDAGQEVNDALVLWQTAQQQIRLSNGQVRVLEEVVAKTELLMKHSSVNYLEVLTAQQSLLSAELTQAQNQFDKIQGVINLYHALGGGGND